MKKYIKDCTRILSDEDIQIWKKGESEKLKKVIGIGLFNSKFQRDEDQVTIYYEEVEGNEVHSRICKLLTDDWFDKLCDDFVALIMEKHEVEAKMMPALIIFDEIDNYPEIASDYIKRRLMRIRTSTEAEIYK